MRLIDADALRKNMEFICMDIMAGTAPFNAPLTEIDNAPTVEERPKGEWIDLGYALEEYRAWGKCSVCGYGMFQSDFCPNCGADMRGDE